MNKKFNFLVFISCYFFINENFTAQTNQWVWMHGDSAQSKPAVFGTKGISNPLNTPGSRYEGVEWTDQNGNAQTVHFDRIYYDFTGIIESAAQGGKVGGGDRSPPIISGGRT